MNWVKAASAARAGAVAIAAANSETMPRTAERSFNRETRFSVRQIKKVLSSVNTDPFSKTCQRG
jgi:hypothetical protein